MKKLTALILLLFAMHIYSQNTFPGGKDAWKEYIKNNLIYPEGAKESGKKGIVRVQYRIDQDGYVSNILVNETLDPLLDREAMRVIAMMPQWNSSGIPSTIIEPIAFGTDDAKGSERKADSIKMARLRRMNVVTRADKMPSFPGGNRALDAFLEENLKYSKSDVKGSKEARVNIDFVVNTDGSLSYIGIKRSVNSKLDTEALRVVDLMPKWNPGTNNGLPVAVYYVLPIIFKGKESNSSYPKVRNRAPMFPGGEGCLDDFIEKHMEYPLSAKNDGGVGRVVVDFIVNANGKISDVNVLKSVDYRLDEEAVRIVSNMPKWNSGINKGQSVAMRCAIPIDFSLHDKKFKSPLFPGGSEAFEEYLQNEIYYPLDALIGEVQGTVVAKYTINSKGKVSDVEFVETVNPSLARVVKRALLGMPKWKPGKANGQTIDTRCTLTVKFIHPDAKFIKGKRPHYNFTFEPFY